MVERPIKKSERQTVTPPSDASEEQKEKGRPVKKRLDAEPSTSQEEKPTQSFREKDRKKGRDRGKQEDSRSRTPVNPALMRGPKPTKPKPPVPVETPEATSEEAATETETEVTDQETLV